MRLHEVDLERFRRRIFRAPPVVAHARPPLNVFLQTRIGPISAAPRLILSDVLDGGPNHGPMCRFTIDGDREKRSFVAPLDHLSFGRQVRLMSLPSRRSRPGS